MLRCDLWPPLLAELLQGVAVTAAADGLRVSWNGSRPAYIEYHVSDTGCRIATAAASWCASAIQ